MRSSSAPLRQLDAVGIVGADDGVHLRRGGVVDWLVVLEAARDEFCAEVSFDGALVDGHRVAAAHGGMLASGRARDGLSIEMSQGLK